MPIIGGRGGGTGTIGGRGMLNGGGGGMGADDDEGTLGTPGGGAGREVGGAGRGGGGAGRGGGGAGREVGGGSIGAEEEGGPEVGVGPIFSWLVPKIPFICCRCLI